MQPALTSFDKLSVPHTALSNNKQTNIVIVGVVLLHVKKNPVINAIRACIVEKYINYYFIT